MKKEFTPNLRQIQFDMEAQPAAGARSLSPPKRKRNETLNTDRSKAQVSKAIDSMIKNQ
jgi:hypothetical protein